jgi:hypothetical protein
MVVESSGASSLLEVGLTIYDSPFTIDQSALNPANITGRGVLL